jgi:hypothetical protein
MKGKDLPGRIKRLDRLAHGFAVDWMVETATTEGVLLPTERDAYREALLRALEGFERARDVLAGGAPAAEKEVTANPLPSQ